jgi:hypothetical protein
LTRPSADSSRIESPGTANEAVAIRHDATWKTHPSPFRASIRP